MRGLGSRWLLWIVGALGAAALLVASAGADDQVTYGVGVSKGCTSPTKVGQSFSCLYNLVNDTSTSKETVIVDGVVDSADRRPGEGPLFNFLSELSITVGSTGDAAPGSQATCVATAGDGVTTPYTGVSKCTLPFGWFIQSAPFDLGAVTQADVDDPANVALHRLSDQVTFNWHNVCDVDTGTCSTQDNIGQASSGTRVIAVPALTTNAKPTGGTIPLALTDVAHLSGAWSDAGGTITFQLYNVAKPGGTECDANTAVGGPLTVAVTGNGDYTSPPLPAGLATNYNWTASYSGDINNAPIAPVGCGDIAEEANTGPRVVGISTLAGQPSPAGVLPATLSDTATLTVPTLPGVDIPITGVVTFRLYSDSSCTHLAGAVTGSVAQNATGPTAFVTSPAITVGNAGTYYWRARYGGDTNNAPAPPIDAINPDGFTTCGAPDETVNMPPLPVTLTTSASSATAVPAKLTDVAHVRSGNANATGTLTFHLYSDSSCSTEVSGSPVTTQVAGLVDGTGDFTSPPITVTQTGAYFWRVSFKGGDANTLDAPLTACRDQAETSLVGGPGTVEICKSGDNGAAGTTFTFTLLSVGTGARQTVQVTGGTCSPAITVLAGKVQVTEDTSSGLWTVSAIQVVPPLNDLADNVAGGSVKIKVAQGKETAVSFTNTPAPAAVKICKYSSAAALQGKQFSFKLLGTTLQARAGASQATAGCSSLLSVQPGATFTITESVPSGEQVSGVAVGGSNTTLNSSAGGVANVTAGPGVNVVYFDNEPAQPAQSGYVEICKDAGDQFVAAATTPFVFTVTDQHGGTQTASVLPGACSAALSVPAGPVTVAEAATTGVQVTAISAIPSSALGLTSLNNRTAVVVVPVSSTPTGEVEVHFTNSTIVTQVKVCKLLGSNSSDLAGQTFTFTVTDDAFPAGTSFTVPVVATTDPNGACLPVSQTVKGVTSTVGFPVGSKVAVTEPAQAFVNGDNSGVNQVDTQTQVVTSGINSVTFTNQAYGQFEVCKNMSDSPGSVYHGLPFTFSYKGVDFPKVTGSFTVGVDACSQPQLVPVGSYTITEQPVLGFGLQSVTATSQGTTNRLVSSSGNSATISVPFFSNPIPGGGDVSVTFTNAPQTATVKVCKQLDPHSTGALSGMTFRFTLKNLNTMASTTSDPVAPNACFQFDDVPIVDATGTAIPYQVTETLNPAKYVPTSIDSSGSSNITVTGTPNNNDNGRIRFSFTGPGNAVFIYTNASP